jgi:hypothetical protein
MVNNSININKNHLSPQLIEFWLILVELLTIIQWVEVSGDFCWYCWNCWHHSIRWCERWFFFILGELLTITQWVKMRGNFYWYWWNCWPSLNELNRGVIFTSTHWVMVNNSTTNINKNHPSIQLIEWWSTIPPISIKVEVRGDVCWYLWNCWPSLNELRWEVIFVDIGRIVPLTSTHWVMVNNSTTNINKNRPSIQLIEWWSTIPPISTKIISHLNSLSDGQQFHQS